MANLETNSISALNGTVQASGLDNFGTAGIIITGTWTGTLSIQGSLNGTTFDLMLWQSISTNVLSSTTTSNGQFLVNVAGLKAIQVKMTSYSSGTADVVIQANAATAIQRTATTIIGATNGTQIGNIGDKLNMAAAIDGQSFANADSFSAKCRVDVTTNSILLSTGVFTNVYSYSGSGLLMAFNVEFNNASVIVRLQVDGETIFSGNSIATLNGLLATSNDNARRGAGSGIVTTSSTLDWSLKKPIKFSSSVVVSADANGGGLFSRSFTQGIFYLTKET